MDRKEFMREAKPSLVALIIVLFILVIVSLYIALWNSLSSESNFNGCTYGTIPEYCQCREMVYDNVSGNCVSEDGKYWCSFWPSDSAIYENEYGCNGEAG